MLALCDTSMIFIKERMLLRKTLLSKSYRKMSAGIEDTAVFLFCWECLFSQPMAPQ